MKKNKKIIFIIFVLVLFLIITIASARTNKEEDNRIKAIESAILAQEALQDKVDAMSIPELVDYIAPQYGQDPVLIKKVVWCESNNNPDAIHDGGHGKGSTGFHKKTFNSWKIKFGHPEYVYESNFDQIALMSEAFSKGEDFRDDWTTYRAIIRGGVYTFWSDLMQKTYTVYCK